MFVCQWVTLQRHSCTDAWAQWRDGDKGCPAAAHSIWWGRLCSSDTIHLPWLNLNLPGCSMSNSLGTTGIRQATSNCFSFRSSAVTKAVQRFSQSSSKRSAIASLPRTRPLWASLLSTVVRKLADVDVWLQILIQGCYSRFLPRFLGNSKLAS